MSDALIEYFRQNLPSEIASITEPYLAKLENGEYELLLKDSEARTLVGIDADPEGAAVQLDDLSNWNDFICRRLGILKADRAKPERQTVFFCIGYAALLLFLQTTATGPVLAFNPIDLLFPRYVAENRVQLQHIRQQLLESMRIDGIAPYKLTHNVELLCLADSIMSCPPILKNVRGARWAKARVGFLHQRLLPEVSSTLQDVIYDDLGLVEESLTEFKDSVGHNPEWLAEFLVERATIHIHHGLDKLARQDLEMAKDNRNFQFALTGRLGKRTKFQQKDTSQLVVLAKSHENITAQIGVRSNVHEVEKKRENLTAINQPETGPKNLELDDDTLLESISFTQRPAESAQVLEESLVPPDLAALDPSDQPQLQSLDSTILLSLASSITNTSPQHGLTREETLPYATRVLEGGSSNWQVYTQALLVRSRIEGYKSRTIERGLLQLQALVDQVIADTTGSTSGSEENVGHNGSTTFLPKSKETESAPASERLRFVFQLASPTRWDLEGELAARWVQLGGLRTALDIYERLQMWAEAALCWAATEREDKARTVVRRQLFHRSDNAPDNTDEDVDDAEEWSGPPRDPPPSDAPRLYCILGDIDQSPAMYEKAWSVSNQRYARAQRSLGRYYFTAKDFVRAAEAYSKSLQADQLNHGSWFALGCILLELEQFEKAVEAFSRCVQLDDTDAEAWSNLAAALLRRNPESDGTTPQPSEDDEVGVEENLKSKDMKQKNRQDALKALTRAATLKHDSYRIWENLLIVAASVSPPDYASILGAQRRIIDLRGSTDGEKCVDIEVLDVLVRHVMSLSDDFDPSKPGLQRMVVKFVDEKVVPLITGSAELWHLVGKLALWRNKPSSVLDAEEKAWRAVTSQPGWETENEERWNEVVEATIRLCDSYENFGPRERTEGMGAGSLVAKDWKFKASSAVRGILGRGKASWEGTDGWDKLKDAMDSLKK